MRGPERPPLATGTMQKMSIRPIAGGCAAFALASVWLLGAATNASAAPARTITVATWGGPYERSQEKAYFEPFTRKTVSESRPNDTTAGSPNFAGSGAAARLPGTSST